MFLRLSWPHLFCDWTTICSVIDERCTACSYSCVQYCYVLAMGADCTQEKSPRSQIVQWRLSMEVHSNAEQCHWVNAMRWIKNYSSFLREYANTSKYLSMHHVQAKENIKWMKLSASEKMMQQWIRLKLNSIRLLDTLFNMVTEKAEFPSPGLIDMMHICLSASGETWITWDHVCLLRVGCTEWISGLFLCLAILLGILAYSSSLQP